MSYLIELYLFRVGVAIPDFRVGSITSDNLRVEIGYNRETNLVI